MSEQADLYRAVLANPEDDAPRLIYADWLDEHGQPERAEFVRVQCATERIPPRTARWRPLNDRAQELEREWRADWTGRAKEMVYDARLRRGFVDRVLLTLDQFAESAAELVRLEPIRIWEFNWVSNFGPAPSFMKLAADPNLALVRGLVAGYYNADELLSTLTDSPHLSELKSLLVVRRHTSPKTLAAFVAAANSLTELSAEDSHYLNLRDIWRRGMKVRLRRLALVRSYVTDQSMAQLAAAPSLSGLESLCLDGNDFSDRGVLALAQSDYLTSLRALSLAEVSIGDNGASIIARSETFRNLRVLNLMSCQIDSAGAQALADSPYLSHLECLCLDENRVSVEVEEELNRRFGPGVCSFGWSYR
jgi:uncharacterized protein (TIGR02996 family)